MGWRVRRFNCTAVHPSTGAIIQWNKIVVDDGNGGTIFEEEDLNRKQTLFDVNNSDFTFLIYPNPSNNYIYLKSNKLKDYKINVTLYSFDLKEVAILYNDIISSEEIRLTLPDISSGNYIIAINSGFNFVSKPISIIK